MKIIHWPMALAFAAIYTGSVWCAEVASPSAPDKTFDKISYADSGGFSGRGTGKSLTLTGDGKLETKRRNSPPKPLQLEAGELAELSKAVAAVDWKSIGKIYPSRGADMFNNDLTIVIEGKPYETHANEMAKIPPPLNELFKRLDALYRRATKEEK